MLKVKKRNKICYTFFLLCVEPDLNSKYGSGFTKLLNSDPILKRIYRYNSD